jgi:hypothetical protein
VISTSNVDEVIPIVCNTDDRVIFANVAAASKRRLPWLGLTPPHSGVAVVVGGGPSMKPLLPMIAGLKNSGATVFALNGVIPTLKLVDVTPDYFVLLDAREENLAFLHPELPLHNLIASQCPPSIFDALEDSAVTVWHPNYPGIEDHIGPGRYALIGGGSTVGLQAMSIAYALGFRTLHLFGFDSSYGKGGEGHAYPQAQNDADQRETFNVGGQEYVAAPWMARQAVEFQTLAVKLAEDDTEIHVHGEGLLPAVAKAMYAAPLTEPEKYRAMWERAAYRDFSPGEGFAYEFVARCKPASLDTVIDCGCGTGRGGKQIKELSGAFVVLVDFAANCLDPDVDRTAFIEADLTERLPVVGDFGYCTDVMEHIPPGDVPAVIANIMAAAPTCFFKIAMFHDNMGALIGHPLHLSVYPAEWWREQFAAYDITFEHDEGPVRDAQPCPYATFIVNRKA